MIFKSEKKIRKDEREKVLQELAAMKPPRARPSSSKNIFGLGGMGSEHPHLLFIPWYKLHNKESEHTKHYTLGSEEQCFFTYFGPMEAWCEECLTGRYGLTTTMPFGKENIITTVTQGIYVYIEDELDYSLFMLKYSEYVRWQW